MTVIVRDTSTLRTISELQVRDGGNVARDIEEIRVRDSNNISRIVFSTAVPLSAGASPDPVSGITAGTGTATTDSTTVTATGGVPPYTYAWTVLTYDNAISPTIGSPSSNVTDFTQTNIGPAESYTAQFQCLVTDDDGNFIAAPCNAFWIDIS